MLILYKMRPVQKRPYINVYTPKVTVTDMAQIWGFLYFWGAFVCRSDRQGWFYFFRARTSSLLRPQRVLQAFVKVQISLGNYHAGNMRGKGDAVPSGPL